jgi:hypothetical protein
MKLTPTLTIWLGLALAAPPVTPPSTPHNLRPNQDLDPNPGGSDLENLIIGAFCAARDNGQVDWNQIPWASILPPEMQGYYEMLFRKLCPLYQTTRATVYARQSFVGQAANFYNEVNKRDLLSTLANNLDPLLFTSGKEIAQLAQQMAQDFGSLEAGQLTPTAFFEKYHDQLTQLRDRALATFDQNENPFPEDTGAFYRFFLSQKAEGQKVQEKMNLRQQANLAEKTVNNQFLLAQAGRVQQKIVQDNAHLDHLRAVTGIDPVKPGLPDPTAPVPQLNRMAEEAISERMAIQVVVRALTEQMSQSASETVMISEYLKTQAALSALTTQQLSMLLADQIERQQAALDAHRLNAEKHARKLYQLGLGARQNVVGADALLANMTRPPYQ